MRIGTSAESGAVSIVFSEYIFVRMDGTLDREFDIQNVKTKIFIKVLRTLNLEHNEKPKM